MKFLPVAACVLLVGSAALAQENPKAEVFGGFSYLTFNCRVIGCVGVNPGALPGWNAETTGFFSRMVGLTVDIGGHYRSFTAFAAPLGVVDRDAHLSQYTFLFGPTFAVRTRRQRPFAHALFGAGHAKDSLAGIKQTDTAWAMALGGGSDLALTRLLGLRLGFDWVRSNNFSTAQNDFRFASGLVFKLPPEPQRK